MTDERWKDRHAAIARVNQPALRVSYSPMIRNRLGMQKLQSITGLITVKRLGHYSVKGNEILNWLAKAGSIPSWDRN